MDIDTDDQDAGSLRILICPHELVVGGSQINAIDLAAALRDRGHVVRVFAPEGPLTERIRAHGLDYAEAPRRRPGIDVHGANALGAQLREFRPDIVHAFESYPTIASDLAWFRRPHRLAVTVLSMSVPDYIPTDVPLTAGTQQLVDGVRGRAGETTLLEPPIDTELDSPVDMIRSRADWGLDPTSTVVAVVGRLSAEHQKARGIAAAIDALAAEGGDMPLTLLIAGDGDAAGEVRDAVSRLDEDGPLRVRLLGNVPDPRSVYGSADVVFGMGGSALRGMAHAKPLIVQGADGFWMPLTPGTVAHFYDQGFFGIGPVGGPDFTELLRELVQNPARRTELGAFSRSVVLERYSLSGAAAQLESMYMRELRSSRPLMATASARIASLGRFAKFRLAVRLPGLQRVSRRLRGRHD